MGRERDKVKSLVRDLGKLPRFSQVSAKTPEGPGGRSSPRRVPLQPGSPKAREAAYFFTRSGWGSSAPEAFSASRSRSFQAGRQTRSSWFFGFRWL